MSPFLDRHSNATLAREGGGERKKNGLATSRKLDTTSSRWMGLIPFRPSYLFPFLPGRRRVRRKRSELSVPSFSEKDVPLLIYLGPRVARVLYRETNGLMKDPNKRRRALLPS